MLPASGLMNPSHISTVVVLPAPLGPSSASTSAAWTSRSSSDTAVVDPYRLLTPRRRTGTADERSREPTAPESEEVTGIQRKRQAWQAAACRYRRFDDRRRWGLRHTGVGQLAPREAVVGQADEDEHDHRAGHDREQDLEQREPVSVGRRAEDADHERDDDRRGAELRQGGPRRERDHCPQHVPRLDHREEQHSHAERDTEPAHRMQPATQNREQKEGHDDRDGEHTNRTGQAEHGRRVIAQARAKCRPGRSPAPTTWAATSSCGRRWRCPACRASRIRDRWPSR